MFLLFYFFRSKYRAEMEELRLKRKAASDGKRRILIDSLAKESRNWLTAGVRTDEVS